MSPLIGQQLTRVAALVVAALVNWLAATFGVDVTTADAETLTAGLTVLGWIILMIVYALVRPILSRFISPSDSAS